MVTKFIGIKKFRKNVTKLWKEARKKNIRYIVMSHSTPILEVMPITEEEITEERLATQIKKARKQFKNGEFYTEEEIFKKYGL